jgi:hypothetical protein
MYIVFILQCQKAQNKCQILYKKNFVLMICYGVLLLSLYLYIVIVSHRRSTWIRYDKNYVLVSDHM